MGREGEGYYATPGMTMPSPVHFNDGTPHHDLLASSASARVFTLGLCKIKEVLIINPSHTMTLDFHNNRIRSPRVSPRRSSSSPALAPIARMIAAPLSVHGTSAKSTRYIDGLFMSRIMISCSLAGCWAAIFCCCCPCCLFC